MKIILLIILTSIYGFAESITQKFLISPTGKHAIGYKDIFITNNTICPDKFYIKGVNESDFSSDNSKYCHEINLRVYYPSVGKPKLGDLYYVPFLLSNIQFYTKQFGFSESEVKFMNSLYKIKTFTKQNSQVSTEQKFPVIVFTPGSGMSVQAYNNIVSELVSHGYIVIGFNSVFVNGATQLNNGHIVFPPDQYHDFGRLENLEDLKFILGKLKYLKYGKQLCKQMDLNSIGLLGHSMGGMSIVTLIKENGNIPNAKAILLMDPGNVLESANYPINNITTPSMIIWSSKFKYLLHGSVTLRKNNFEVLMTPLQKNIDYSNHENFSDLSTIQYYPVYQVKPIHDLLINKNYLGVGVGNGYTISKSINSYVVNFFNYYLKNTESTFLTSCHKINSNTILSCGAKN